MRRSFHSDVYPEVREGIFMECLILANGEPPSFKLLEELARKSDLFIAADGAADVLAHFELVPDIILGDFDSLLSHTRSIFPAVRYVHAYDQEECDLDKAIAFAIEQKADRITLSGVLGGRPDHMLTTISILMKYTRQIDIVIADDGVQMKMVQDTWRIDGEPGDTLSLVVFDRAAGVCLDGVRWRLRDAELTPGSRGVSNEFLQDQVSVSVKSGMVLVCHLSKYLIDHSDRKANV
jgi:thiamine pyrophosphokinase